VIVDSGTGRFPLVITSLKPLLGLPFSVYLLIHNSGKSDVVYRLAPSRSLMPSFDFRRSENRAVVLGLASCGGI
jgi:hypothetical protein